MCTTNQPRRCLLTSADRLRALRAGWRTVGDVLEHAGSDVLDAYPDNVKLGTLRERLANAPRDKPTTAIVIHDGRNLGPRTTARVLDLEQVAREALEKALRTGRVVVRARHGGSVANAYSYAAETDAVIVIARPESGHVEVWAERVPANKVTLAGAADRALPGAGAIYDGRTSLATAQRAVEALLEVIA